MYLLLRGAYEICLSQDMWSFIEPDDQVDLSVAPLVHNGTQKASEGMVAAVAETQLLVLWAGCQVVLCALPAFPCVRVLPQDVVDCCLARGSKPSVVTFSAEGLCAMRISVTFGSLVLVFDCGLASAASGGGNSDRKENRIEQVWVLTALDRPERCEDTTRRGDTETAATELSSKRATKSKSKRQAPNLAACMEFQE